jgi:hypothetical protein
LISLNTLMGSAAIAELVHRSTEVVIESFQQRSRGLGKPALFV